jgi:hypothetical protein
MADENGLYSICVKKEGGGKELAEAHWPGKFAVRLVCRDEVVCSWAEYQRPIIAD